MAVKDEEISMIGLDPTDPLQNLREIEKGRRGLATKEGKAK